MIPRLHIGDSELVAVPAIHNLSVFAEHVNRICRDEHHRPGAIAVELSHDAVAAVVAWMRELGISAGRAAKMPTMLGLLKSNHCIHPRHREAAIRLQEIHGLPLHKIPVDILRRELGFAPVSLLCLSTTDSMLEAIRCALELELPVHGIDLGEVAEGERGQPMIQDPLQAQHDFEGYILRNQTICDPHRDDTVDGRREWAMAARLKRLLREHRRVLFTGGLGHWQQLCRRLGDTGLAASAEPSRSEGERYTRAIVAPALAIHQMDLFPELARTFEAIRQLPAHAPERRMDFPAVYRTSLAAACECAEARNREAVLALAQFLNNLSLVQPCRVPDLFMTLNAARAMVSSQFATRLADMLVNKALDWATPKDFPGLPYLDAARGGSSTPRPASDGLQAELRNGRWRSAPFYLSHLAANQQRAGSGWPTPQLPDLEGTSPNGERRNHSQSSWVWPPCETLLYGTAYAAAENADQNQREQVPESFSGSLHDGVHVKATLRAITRGERRVQVKVHSRVAQALAPETVGEPSVFIFETPETVKDGWWGTFLAADSAAIRNHVQDQAGFDAVTSRRGHDFVVSIHYGTDREAQGPIRNHARSLRYFYGVVIFGCPSLTPQQAARWLEESRYAACPIMSYASGSNVMSYFHREHAVALDAAQWPASLVRMALPYARRRVVVIMPPRLVLPPQVLREAGARRISLDLQSLSQFTPERIERIRHQYLVRPTDVDRMEYPEAMQAAFGESPRQHLDLLPAQVRAQLET